MDNHIAPQNSDGQPISGSLKTVLVFFLLHSVAKLIVSWILITWIVALVGFASQKFGPPNFTFLIVASVLLLGVNALVFYHIIRAFKGNVKSVRFMISVEVIDVVAFLIVSVFLAFGVGVVPFLVGLLFLASSVAWAVFLDKGIAR